MALLSRQGRVKMMLCINFAFFIAEITVGYYASSLALVADSFHMLNDVLSLVVALWAIRVASQSEYNPKYSYGWQRAEVLGAMVNAVFLVALSVMIVIEAIQRFVEPDPITDPRLVLFTACAGLAGNLVGLLLFHDHGHGHHHHAPDNEKKPSAHQQHHGGHLNMKGIFLHVMGDALGNIGVIATALFVWLTDFSWRFYMDPVISFVISIVIFISAIPLIKETSFILLQASSVAVDDVKNDLSKLDDVVSVHELHIWQLSDTKFIATLHVLLKTQAEYLSVATSIRTLLHKRGVHSVTIQPEFLDNTEASSPHSSLGTVAAMSPSWNASSSTICLLRCADESCAENTCCPLPYSM
ncbi:cation efflux protein [Dichotomocladium elegans]|nr:cation efflux protein [Dichotomocladium elegans]